MGESIFMSNISLNSAPTVPRMRTIRQTAQELQFPEHAIRQLVKQRRITFVQCGNKVLINLDRLIDYLNAGEVLQ